MEFKQGAGLAQRLILATVCALSYPISAAAATDLPVYPAAKTQPMTGNGHMGASRCGHTFTVEKSLTVDADPHAVAKWYESRLPGSRTIDLSRVLSGGDSYQKTTIQVFAADGAQTVVVSRMYFHGTFAGASKTLGMDTTNIGIESISPPLAPEYIALTAQLAAGGASAQKAQQQMEAACKD